MFYDTEHFLNILFRKEFPLTVSRMCEKQTSSGQEGVVEANGLQTNLICNGPALHPPILSDPLAHLLYVHSSRKEYYLPCHLMKSRAKFSPALIASCIIVLMPVS